MWPSVSSRIPLHFTALCLLALALAGCSLPIKAPVAQNTFRLNSGNVQTPAIVQQGKKSVYLIQLSTLQAMPGFDTPQMMYSRDAQSIEPYRDSRWLAPPSELLSDVIEQTLLKQPWVAGVVSNSATAPVAVQLSCRLIRLEHDIDGKTGRAHLVMNCFWSNPVDRTIEAHWRFDQTRPLPRNDAAQFAAASQKLVDQAVKQIVQKTREVIVAHPNTSG